MQIIDIIWCVSSGGVILCTGYTYLSIFIPHPYSEQIPGLFQWIDT